MYQHIEYKWKICVFVGLLILFSSSQQMMAANLLSSTNFEADGWQSQFTGESVWSTHVARTTKSPAFGNYSLRGNQKESVTDPITNLTGKGNNLLDWRGNGNIVSQTPHEMYFSYWFKHDDYNWNDSGDGKLFYFVDPNYSIRAMYYARQLQEGRNTLKITYTNGGYSDAWALNNWGGMFLYLGNPNVTGTMGVWRHFEYYINYDKHYFMQWVDGHLMKPTNGKYPDGKIYYDANLNIHWQGFQLFYADSRDVGTSSNTSSGYAAGWQIDNLEVWNGMPDGTTDQTPVPPPVEPTDQSPVLAFTAPTTSSSYSIATASDQETVEIAGTADDDGYVRTVRYSTDNGQNGEVISNDNFATWRIPITVQANETITATITVTDDADQNTTKTMTISCTSQNSTPAFAGWDAKAQTGDSTWTNSSVTYCVRLLVQGSSIAGTSGGRIVLGFQGRSTGGYTIRNVSIAEKDTRGNEGDVIDSTWTQVLFDGGAWNGSVTVGPNSERMSDPANIYWKPGTDYYVTFKIDSPSVYLDPPSGYRELYFNSEDHTSDIDWGSNGYSTTQDYHALSKIYVVAPGAPRDFVGQVQ